MQRWTSDLDLTGFAKVGYPGVIYCEGEKEGVVDFVGRVKAMQWLALRIRFVQEVGDNEGKLDCNSDEAGLTRKWIELEKVGEVVDYMRRIGREHFVLELGLGASSSAT